MTDRSAAWERIDPEVRSGLQSYLEATGGGVNQLATFAEQRAAEEALRLAAPPNPYEGRVATADHQVPDGPRVRVYRPAGTHPANNHPANNEDLLPAILDIHGGGMVRGSLAGEEVNAGRLAVELSVVVVSVDYRLAPEHPYPAAIDDCYAALQWLHAQAESLGVDPARVAIYGASAGGGIAAGTALLARDRGGPPLCLQALVYPMIDDRNVTPSSHDITDIGIWDRAANLAGWAAYLGPLAGSDDVPAYAAPSRAANLRGLPPTYLDVGDVDLFRDEDVDYARRLIAAGVPTELHVYPGGIHASHIAAATSELAIRTTDYRLAALARALHQRDGLAEH